MRHSGWAFACAVALRVDNREHNADDRAYRAKALEGQIDPRSYVRRFEDADDDLGLVFVADDLEVVRKVIDGRVAAAAGLREVRAASQRGCSKGWATGLASP